MKITFYKYHGAGNDFVMIDDRTQNFPIAPEIIAHLCHRRFGIGADGLILLQNDEETDFSMRYFNADGNESTMCGNGGRCIVAFARDLAIIQGKCTFNAIDGVHEAEIYEDTVNLKMIDVSEISIEPHHYFLNTGSPHHVEYHEDIHALDVVKLGAHIRNAQAYAPQGTNVNFVQKIGDNYLFVRTYERGVEDETLACGTGATAAAITWMLQENTDTVKVKVLGGELSITAQKNNNSFENIWLKGPAVCAFQGEIVL